MIFSGPGSGVAVLMSVEDPEENESADSKTNLFDLIVSGPGSRTVRLFYKISKVGRISIVSRTPFFTCEVSCLKRKRCDLQSGKYGTSKGTLEMAVRWLEWVYCSATVGTPF